MARHLVDHFDGYQLGESDHAAHDQFLADSKPRSATTGDARLDGFSNALTGIGDPNRDKVMGGSQGGPCFIANFLTGWEVENRWRGSDLGAKIVETLPGEMTREGWGVRIQPTEGEDEDDAQQIIEELTRGDEELDVNGAVRIALEYENAYGGGAVLIGVDDGKTVNKPIRLDARTAHLLGEEMIGSDDGRNLTTPIDERSIRTIHHLTPFRGGWDGELIAWRYYNDPRKKNYGKPEIYMLRNIGVPLSSPPAPGEVNVNPQAIPTGPTGALIFFVHESRLLVFPGKAVSARARVQMRGWGDGVFVRVNEVLYQFGQTWGGIANLMTDWSQGVLQVDGLAEMLTGGDGGDDMPGGGNGNAGDEVIAQRLRAVNISRSLARMLIIDKDEDFKRETASLTGIAEVLEQFALRLSAAVGIPVSMLFGQVKGGLGDAGNSDKQTFYDQVAGKQRSGMKKQLMRYYHLRFLAKDSPTNGVEPERWDIEFNPLYQPTEKEVAETRKLVAETDQIYIANQVLTPEEVAASAYGGARWSMERTIDVEGRKTMSAALATTEPGEPAPEDPNAKVPPVPKAPAPAISEDPEKPEDEGKSGNPDDDEDDGA